MIWLSVCLLLVYRSTCDFCALILASRDFAKVDYHLKEIFGWDSGSSKYAIMSSANRDSLTSSFPDWITFISFSCLIAMARTSSTMLNRNGERGHPCLVLVYKENASSFCPFSMILAVGLLFVILRYIPSIPSLLRVFSMKGCWILLKAFSASIEIIMWFLSLVLFMWWIMFIGFRMLNQPCIPGMNPTWSWWISFLMCFCNWLASILLKIFHLCSS